MAEGMVKVDGQIVNQNVLVSGKNIIQVGAKTGINTPVKENTRIWIYNKPRGCITSHHDPQNRPTVFHHLKQLGLDIPHIISVG